MTNELEKTFLDTFGIKISRCTKDGNCYFQECSKCDWYIHTYPQITDHILLELICILTRWHLDEREPYEITSINTEQLKNQILSNSLDIAKCVKTKEQVQAIFK